MYFREYYRSLKYYSLYGKNNILIPVNDYIRMWS